VPTAFLALGSNLGDRMSHLEIAVRSLDVLGVVAAGSPVYETAPVGGPEQASYLNAIVSLETEMSPIGLLNGLLEIEKVAGRVRNQRWGPRTLDLDILTYGDETSDEPGLTIPHPEIRHRRFVLAPLADVAVGLSDDDGAFADALVDVADQEIRRLTGPYDVDERRWMLGIEAATELDASGDVFCVRAHQDWSNPSGDMFGAFLSAVVLRSVGLVARDHQPSSITYRFIHGIEIGSDIEVSPVTVRSTTRSADYVVSLSVEGEMMGRASVTTIAEPRTVTIAPTAPHVVAMSQCVPVDELFAPIGRLVGASARSWRPLERWDIPDLAGGDTGLFRAWSPNLTLGTDDPFMRAAGILMPIDALIWPSTMFRLGRLGTSEIVLTPTLEFSGRFPDLSTDPGWHLSEVTVDHMTDRSIAGSIRVWADDGTYLSVGTSHNLVVEGDELIDRD